MNRLQDRRVKKVVVFDTETAPYYEKVKPYWKTGCKDMPKDYQVYNNMIKAYLNKKGETVYEYMTEEKKRELIFDIGWTIADKQGNIFIKRNYLVDEIFTDMKLMKHAFYFEKYPQYLRMLQDGKIKLAKWNEIILQMEKDILDYNIYEAYAFNIAFDKGALENTHRILLNRPFLFWKVHGMKTNDIWGMAAETILSKKSFIETAIEQKWLSEAGNIRTNAETAYKYITGMYDFQEAHTALEDAIIETEIMARCFKTRKRMSFGIIPQPWRIVRDRAITLGLLEDYED